LQHWCWQPMRYPAVPVVKQKAWVENPIDHFILSKIESHGLVPAQPADKRTFIRRLAFDLTGLPPTTGEIERFLANNASNAYEQLVDEYLASPAYGERWARHWLDVVHYGDTHGYDKDKPRPNAWPYRDYVIRAFNEDKPYAQFVAEQIAGDMLFPKSRDGYEALGFIAAGPWDFISHAEVPESKIDGKIARHLDRDDMIANTIGTFCSITIHCAQCHDHKFDPVTQEDYYSLQAVFAALDRADKPYFENAEKQQQYHKYFTEQQLVQEQLKKVESEWNKAVGPRWAELEKLIKEHRTQKSQNMRAEYGYHSALVATANHEKWVQLDLGKSCEISEIVLFPCYDDFNNIGAGFGFPSRYKIEVADDATFQTNVSTVFNSIEDIPNPGTQPQVHKVKATGQFVRVTATKLALRSNDYMLALAELKILNAAGENLATASKVSSLDSIEAPVRWTRQNLVDGHYATHYSSAELEAWKQEQETILTQQSESELYKVRQKLQDSLQNITLNLKQLGSPNVVYAGTIHYGAGAFAGTGSQNGKPRTIHVLARGDVQKPKQPAIPGALSAVHVLPARFTLPENHSEGERRVALANWLTNAEHPLLWRSIANRVWLYHFGRGIVETPNDFGRNGAMPSHAELLDYLALYLRDNKGSIKKLHRLICNSATYRQSSQSQNSQQDVLAQALFARQQRRKLEAEAIRDAMLTASGQLDRKMGGPGFQDFVVEHPEHSPHYVYEKANPFDTKLYRRSVYRFLVRSQTQPFMTSLDCADPSMRVEKRNESQSALQSLALLNNGFVLAQAQTCGDNITQITGNNSINQAHLAFQTILSRQATTQELAACVELIEQHGLPNLCRALFNLNEFVFVD
jgi:Protein of unknown function (DUF1549)/Protein of unknown function (DUF1553)